MNKYIFLFTFLLLTVTSNCQFILGKNINDGSTELKRVLKAKGFNFLSQRKIGEKPGYGDILEMKFKEEFRIVLFLNEYDNIFRIDFNTLKEKNYLALKRLYSYTQWAYIGTDDYYTQARDYQYKNYKITDCGLSKWAFEPEHYVFMILMID